MPEPVDIAAGLRAMQARDFLSSAKYAEQQTIARTEGAHPHIIEFTQLFVRRMAKKHYVPIYAHTMRRTMQEQYELLGRKVTRDSPADGLWPHQWHAVDIVHSILHWQLDKKSWAVLGHIGKELAKSRGFDIVWGGDWKYYDPAHWEIRNWKTQGPEDFPVVANSQRQGVMLAQKQAMDYVERNDPYNSHGRSEEGQRKKEE